MEEKDLKMVQECMCFRLRAAARKVTRTYEEALKPVGLRATQFTLLAMIIGTEPNSMTDLAKKVGMDRTTVNRALNILVSRRWVRVISSDARTEKKIRITKEGEAKFKEALPLWKDVQQKFVARSGKDDWDINRNWLMHIVAD
ncbi:MAG: MarR family transcriptional regulator [Desulfocapsaceae bacterium]|nr:MarR family transcriptional regulator [Desulfocapsaceae bacterium]